MSTGKDYDHFCYDSVRDEWQTFLIGWSLYVNNARFTGKVGGKLFSLVMIHPRAHQRIVLTRAK